MILVSHSEFIIKGDHHDLPTMARLGVQEHAVEAELSFY